MPTAPRLLAAILLCATLAVAAPKLEPQQAGFSPERLERLTHALQAYVDRNEVAGITALVARRGEIAYLETFGHRDVAADAPMTDDTIFRIASMTKPIVTTALMMLWEEGHFQLRDPISKFLPEFRDMQVALAPPEDQDIRVPTRLVAARNAITFQQLLTHTAGLANPYRGSALSYFQEFAAVPTRGQTLSEYSKRLAKLPLNFEPGERWEYGPAITIAGHLVEVISGQPLDEFLRERILDPLGMPDTHFYLPKDKLPRFAANYRPNSDGKFELAEAPDAESAYVRLPHRFFSGSGGLVSTARDYFRFQQMMLNGGKLGDVRIIGPRTVRLMTTNHIGEKPVWLRGPGTGFGLGYAVVTDMGQSAMPGAVGTFGWGGAFGTVTWVDPEDELIGVLMLQIRPYSHLNVRKDFQTLVYQAIVD